MLLHWSFPPNDGVSLVVQLNKWHPLDVLVLDLARSMASCPHSVHIPTDWSISDVNFHTHSVSLSESISLYFYLLRMAISIDSSVYSKVGDDICGIVKVRCLLMDTEAVRNSDLDIVLRWITNFDSEFIVFWDWNWTQ